MLRSIVVLSVGSALALALWVPATLQAVGDAHPAAPVRSDDAVEWSAGAVESEFPNTQSIDHDIGQLWLTVTNWGCFGPSYPGYQAGCVFPAGSNTTYLYWGTLWIGSIDDTGDTLVTAAWEYDEWPLPWSGWCFLPGPLDGIDDEKDSVRVEQVISEQDYIACYSDTATHETWPDYVGPGHTPQGIEVTQRTYAWGRSHLEDFVVLDFSLKNVGFRTLHNVYMALHMDPDCGHWLDQPMWETGWDDVTGLRRWRAPGDTLWPGGTTFYSDLYPGGIDVGGEAKVESPTDCINLAWAADGSGVSDPDRWHTPCATGMRLLRASNPCAEIAYNWWAVYEWDPWYGNEEVWGPTDPANPYDVGVPGNDDERYRVMSNRYIDPDQLDPVNGSHAVPRETSYLVSVGPLLPVGGDPRHPDGYSFAPGDSAFVTLVYTGGEEFHEDFVVPSGPGLYEGHYDFADIATNAYLAYRIFDTPGLDTDGDGYRGAYVVYVSGDTVWVTGDGVPDVAAAADPPEEEPASGPPAEIGLLGMWPNPCENRLLIRYALREAEQVEVKIYNLLGQLVATLLDRVEDAGVHELVWDTRDASGRELASGVYFCRYLAGRVGGKASFVVVR